MDDIILEYDAFLRSLNQNSNYQCALLLGAGTSVTSGVQSANDCIWEWKRDIYISKNPEYAKYFSNFKLENVRKQIQSWLDLQGDYPKLGSPEEYSFYAEKAYPISSDRTNYFKNLVSDKEPYIGYKLICLLNKLGIIKSVWTTNFDGLVERAAQSMNITPIAVNLDNYAQVYNQISNNEILCVALHGDYKFSSLKNTENELDNQSQIFKEVLSHYLVDKSLIVLGYSGRDKSLMQMLEESFSNSGIGKLYWCGYRSEVSAEVRTFINKIRSKKREAYYIPTNGFDVTMCDWAQLLVSSKYPYSRPMFDNIVKINKKDETISPFFINDFICNTHIKSNLHPITFPKELYQFEVQNSELLNYKQLQQYIKEKDIVAVPFKGKIYSLGRYADIQNIFGSSIKGDVQRISVSIDDIHKNPHFMNLMKQAIVRSISLYSNLESDGRSCLWKKSFSRFNINNCTYQYNEGVKIKLYFPDEKKYGYITFRPYIHFDDNVQLPKTVLIQLNKNYFDKLFNNKYSGLLDTWTEIIFGKDERLNLFYPANESSGFSFVISRNVAYAGIKNLNNTGYMYYPGKDINPKQVVLKGISISEPKLMFSSNAGTLDDRFSDIHPMRGLITNKPFDSFLDTKDVLLGVICSSNHSEKLYDFLQQINNRWNANRNDDYIIDFPGFQNAFASALLIPNKNDSLWSDIVFPANQENDLVQAYELARNIKTKITQMNCVSPNAVLVIFIPNEWEKYKHIENDNEVFDLHNNIKAFSVQRGISTQFIEESTLSDSLKCQIYWWLSLSFYVKSLKTPWVLSEHNKKTAYAGIGYSVKRGKNTSNIVLGCSHIYNSDGLGLKYRLSNIKENEVTFDNKKNPYLSYNEAYKFGMNICELFYETMQNLPDRVVIHKRTEFKKDEKEGIIDSLKKAGVENIDLVSINFEKDQKFIAMSVKNGKTIPDLYPIRRGTCIIVNDNQLLLWAHGIVPSVRNPKFRYYQGGRSIPSPLLITHHYGHSDLVTIADEILGLTKMNWNSFNMYTKLPATIDSSNKIAIIGSLFSDFDKTTYDYRYFI